MNEKVIVDGVIAVKLANGKFIPFSKGVNTETRTILSDGVGLI